MNRARAANVQSEMTRPVFLLLLAAGLALGAPADGESTSSNALPRRFKIPRSYVKGFPRPAQDPPAVVLGERLFLETRFSQYFFSHSAGNVNASLTDSDTVVGQVQTSGTPLPGPFAGFAINCRSCHFVNEFAGRGPGFRTYADFARRSPVPAREDGRRLTVRNSPSMVNSMLPRDGTVFLHADGEFVSGADLARGTLTGRNFGWLPREHDAALRHVAHVIRDDDGRGPLAREFGGHSYRAVMASTDPGLSEDFVLPEESRFEVAGASDEQIFDAVAGYLETYMGSLLFGRDAFWGYDGSPYDAFLETNRISTRLVSDQTHEAYNRFLLSEIENIPQPTFVRDLGFPWRYKLLKQEFQFGPEELRGLKIFFRQARYATNGPTGARSGIGNCVACHRAPEFTDFAFHNTGASQEEYDSIHGAGSFLRLRIPGAREREKDFNRWLPPTPAHPDARGPFLAIPSADAPGHTDLGLWNVFANPDIAAAQPALLELLHASGASGKGEALLPKTIGLFKTPSLRALNLSDPYLHNGSKNSVEDVLRFYVRQSRLARAGKILNAAPELGGILLEEADVAPLAAFLRALSEDYE
jgi:cytochrome c peroxidase